MNIKSEKTTINKPTKTVFSFLKEAKNFKDLMPENTVKFELPDTNTFLFGLKGMPEIALKREDLIEFEKISYRAANGKIDFHLILNIKEVNANKSELEFNFEGEFNSMMAMMIKKPITNFINTLANNSIKVI